MKLRLLIMRLFIHLLALYQRRRFETALQNPQKQQKKVLSDILMLTKMSRLPEMPTEYKDYPSSESWTVESIKFYETTSGNSGKKKPIPYTFSLLRSFQNLFLLWMDDLLTFHSLKTGKLFISISPKLESLGMNSDLDYLNPILRFLINPFVTVPPADFSATNGHDFFKKIAVRLLNDSQLECISIWSPTYWISLLEFIEQHVDILSSDVEHSTVKKIQVQNWPAIWPHLKIISCWTDGNSYSSAQKLKEMFPDVIIQGKGLLSTEAPMTIPWTLAAGCVPLWTEVYLEYIDRDGLIKPLDTLKVDQEAELVISTKGGLLRYRIGDIVRCTHIYKSSPVLKFVRRAGEVSDLVGEKLDSAILVEVFTDLPNGNWFLVANSDHYVFVCDFEISAQEIDSRLCQSFHYNLARELRQLKRARVYCISDLSRKMMFYYADRKIKLGDIKVRLLWTDPQILNSLEISKSSDSFL